LNGLARVARVLLVTIPLAWVSFDTPLAQVAQPPAAPSAAAAPVQPPATAPAPFVLAKLADEVSREVEQLRGWTFKRPVRKERISLQGARQDLRQMLLSSQRPDERARQQAMLRVAGLVPADCDLVSTSLVVLEQQVAGYYEPSSRTLRLVERPTPVPQFVERMILSHELTHALDDQYIDLLHLSRLGRASQDMDFVVTALGEGSATSLMLQHMMAAQKSGRFTLADLSQYVAQELERARSLEQLPRYFSAMFGSYIVGAAFLAKGELETLMTLPDNRTIGENLLAARRALPRSGEQILHAEKYWDPARRDEPVLIDDKAAERWLAAPGRIVLHRDTLGELMTAILTEPRGAVRDMAKLQSTAGWTNAGASGWGGDRFYLLSSSRAQTDTARATRALQGVWVTAWDTLADRDEFIAALEKGGLPPGGVVEPVATRLAIVFLGMTTPERRVLMTRLDTAPLPMLQDGRPWR
jgi:hypothetical protein